MTRLSQLPRVKLTEDDKSSLVFVATQYEQAQGLYAEADDKSSLVRYRAMNGASKIRARATEYLMKWANHRIDENTSGGVGYGFGANNPRLKKAYDASYDHRKWGSAGCAREAAKFIRKVIKRGWL